MMDIDGDNHLSYPNLQRDPENNLPGHRTGRYPGTVTLSPITHPVLNLG